MLVARAGNKALAKDGRARVDDTRLDVTVSHFDVELGVVLGVAEGGGRYQIPQEILL